MARKTLEIDTETTAAQYADQLSKHLLNVAYVPKPSDGTLDMSTIRGQGLPIGKINRVYGHNPKFDFNHVTQSFNYLSQSAQAASQSFMDLGKTMDAMRKVWRGEKDHRLTLKDLRGTTPKERFDKTIDKLVKFTNLLIDEHVLLHAFPKKVELIRLMRLFIKGQPRNVPKDEYCYGKLSLFDTGMGITIRMFPTADERESGSHTLIYNTVLSYETKGELNLQEPPMVEANWRPDLADEALQLLREATVLDALAEVLD